MHLSEVGQEGVIENALRFAVASIIFWNVISIMRYCELLATGSTTGRVQVSELLLLIICW